MVIEKLGQIGEGRKKKQLAHTAELVNTYEPEVEDLSDAELAGKTAEFRERLEAGETLDDLLPEAFASVREAARRTIGQRHFDVQVMGAVALHQGNIAEMKTGEGKTLTSTMAAYLNSLGDGVHVVTVNDYLAKRDSEWMGPIYRALGVSVGLIQSAMSPSERRPAYAADITYGTNNEFGFDYLRDNMAMRPEDMVQRGHAYAIVDEVDSILIDEARTPLIISGMVADSAKWYLTFARLAPRLKRDEDYEVDEAKKTIAVTEAGVAKVEEALGLDNLYEHVHTPLVHHLQNSLRAKEHYHRDVEYIVTGGEVKIVDEFTGRVLEGRRYSEGLHQAIEAKEGVRIKEENQTLATITIQNYFKMYEKLAGMTGTAKTQLAEFQSVYDLDVAEVPTNREMIRDDQQDLIYKTEDAKWNAVLEDIADRHEQGQPILVGTVSIEKSEKLSTLLNRRGIEHHVLNAKNHEKEAMIVAQAGRLGSVTVATNMAGRGVDILLGGNPEYLARQEMAAREWDNDAYLLFEMEPEERVEYEAEYEPIFRKLKQQTDAEHDEVVAVGGLYVLGTERHESRRIDNQLRGRAGRQGDPGSLAVLPVARGRPDADVRVRPDRLDHGAAEVAGGRGDHGQDGHQGGRGRAAADRGAELRATQERPEVRRRDEHPAPGDLRGAREAALGRGLQGRGDPDGRGRGGEDRPAPGAGGGLQRGVGPRARPDGPHRGLPDTSISGEDLEEMVSSAELSGRAVEDALERYEEKEQALGSQTMRELERLVLLNITDTKWREHLYEMDYLQEGIHLRAYAQKDPLTEYRREAYLMFEELTESIQEDFVKYIYRVELVRQDEPGRPRPQRVQTQHGDEGQGEAAGLQAKSGKVPRNAPCPCGSGKKYKKCHGAVA